MLILLVFSRNPISSVSSRSAAVRAATWSKNFKFPLSHYSIVVLLKAGPSAGKIAVIAEIVDHNRVRQLPFTTSYLSF